MPLPPLAANVVLYGTPSIPLGRGAAVVMIRLVVTLTLSVTVIDSESTTSGNVTESITEMVSLSVTMAGAETELLQVTETLLMLAEATVPVPLVTVQVSPVGCVPTVTA